MRAVGLTHILNAFFPRSDPDQAAGPQKDDMPRTLERGVHMEEKATAKNKAVSVVASVALAATLGVPTAAFADDAEKSATQQAIEQQAGEAGQDAVSDESEDSAAAATGDAVDASSDAADGAEGESASVALLSNDASSNDAAAGQEAEKSVA